MSLSVLDATFTGRILLRDILDNRYKFAVRTPGKLPKANADPSRFWTFGFLSFHHSGKLLNRGNRSHMRFPEVGEVRGVF